MLPLILGFVSGVVILMRVLFVELRTVVSLVISLDAQAILA